MYKVGIYHIDRAYGGPEEGGWWYTTGMLQPNHPVESFASKDEAIQYAKDWNDKAELDENLNKGLPPIGSVLSVGRLQARFYEDECPEMFPEHIPHYE